MLLVASKPEISSVCVTAREMVESSKNATVAVVWTMKTVNAMAMVAPVKGVIREIVMETAPEKARKNASVMAAAVTATTAATATVVRIVTAKDLTRMIEI